MSRALQSNDLPWEQVRPALTSGVYGRTLLDKGTKVVYTRVEAGGGFAAHVDPYRHLLYILSGSGTAHAGGVDYRLEPGVALEIEAGEEHSYRNTGPDPLELISLNLPA
jgi:mannose-6-phosphate isomerase-like protein (cupin superfamily)